MLIARVRRLRPSRYLYLARKYWRANRLRLWWVGHVVDEVRVDWTGHRIGHRKAGT